jgi:hypothetical protein
MSIREFAEKNGLFVYENPLTKQYMYYSQSPDNGIAACTLLAESIKIGITIPKNVLYDMKYDINNDVYSWHHGHALSSCSYICIEMFNNVNAQQISPCSKYKLFSVPDRYSIMVRGLSLIDALLKK